MIEKLAYKLSAKLAYQLNYDADQKAILSYGLIGILQMATIFIIISIIGVTFNFWYESLLIYIGVGFLRKSTGGAHSKTMIGCIIMSVMSITLLSATSRYLIVVRLDVWIDIAISFFIFTYSILIFYLRVPVDNPNKPIVKPDKIKRLRKQSFIKLGILFLITLIFIVTSVFNNRFYSFAISIRLAILWQLLTLTKTGIFILNKIDFSINCKLVKDKI